MNLNLWDKQRVEQVLLNHGVVAYPTEAVFGFGCLPQDLTAIEKILAIKHRPISKGLILVASSLEQVLPFVVSPSADERKLILSPKERPTTYLLRARNTTGVHLKGRFSTLAIRISDHPIVRQLCDHLEQPLVSTSANITGKRPASTALQVRLQFATKLDHIVDAPVGEHAQVSDIYDLTSHRYLRKA